MKSRSINGIHVEWTPIRVEKQDGKWWSLCSDLTIHMTRKGVPGVWTILLRKGWSTDFGSIPSRLLGVVNNGTTDEELLLAYLIHDGWYQFHFSEDRKEADKVLCDMADGCDGVDPWDPSLIYWAVRLFGSGAWEGNPKDLRRRKNECIFEHKDKH